MQDTQELTLPVTKKTVLIRGYVTGLIDQQVNKVLLSSMTMQGSPDEIAEGAENSNQIANQMLTANLATTIDADYKLLELMLLAVDGDNGANAYDQLMALPKADVDYVLGKVKELQKAGQVSDPKDNDSSDNTLKP